MRLTLAAAFLALSAHVAQAQPSETLEKIKESGFISIGHRDAYVPFSYVISSGAPIGYSIDLCMKIVDAVKEKLKLPNLQIKYTSVTAQNRIPLLQNGTIDLECGVTTNSVARQEQVAFSPSYFSANITAAVKKSSGIKSFADLAGKTAVATSGSTGVQLLRVHRRNENLDVKETFGKDAPSAFLDLAGDRAAAFVTDDVVLAGLIATSAKPEDYKILTESLRSEPYGAMLRKGDPQFKSLVDQTITGIMKSGEINEIYAKWFMRPVPPRDVSLNFPQSDTVKELFRNPNDKGV